MGEGGTLSHASRATIKKEPESAVFDATKARATRTASGPRAAVSPNKQANKQNFARDEAHRESKPRVSEKIEQRQQNSKTMTTSRYVTRTHFRHASESERSLSTAAAEWAAVNAGRR